MNGRRYLRFIRRIWVPLVVVVALATGGVAVERLHGIFGSTRAGTGDAAGAEQIVSTNPKSVAYEVFGPVGTSGMISYLDENAQAREADFDTLPWSVTLTTTSPSVLANISAQGDGPSLGCRIVVNGVVRDEQVSDAHHAMTFCLVKAA